jgi:hypothetical protein
MANRIRSSLRTEVYTRLAAPGINRQPVFAR